MSDPLALPTASPPAPPLAPRGGRWAPIWQLGLYLLALIVVRIAGDLLGGSLHRLAPTDPSGRPLSLGLRLLGLLPGILAMDLTYRGLVRRIEHRRPRELEGPRLARELSMGLLLGALMMSGIVGVLAIAGCYRVSGINAWTPVLLTLAIALVSGYGEEIVARGVLMRFLGQFLGVEAGWWVSSLFFGLLHAANPHATLLSVASIVCAGLLLGAAYRLTGRLWLAIGLHIAWNFTQGGVFGIAISGYAEPSILAGSLGCATIWSGGSFGVEGSVLALVVCAGTAAALATVAKRRARAESAALAASAVSAASPPLPEGP